MRKSAYITRYRVRKAIKGLSQYLSGQASEEEIRYTTNFQNVDIIFAGPVAPNPSELLGDPSMGELLADVRDKYDYILIDSPPMMNIIDAAVLARVCDGAILVIESGRVSYKEAQRVLDQLQKSECRILGAVLNKVDIKNDKSYSKYSSYYGSYKAK